MNPIINLEAYRQERNLINVSQLRQGAERRLSPELISPAREDVSDEVYAEHSAEPIKSLDDIARIQKYLLDNYRYRDNMLFIVGINFGLRISDLKTLRFANLITDDFTFRDKFPIFEKKTRNTRRHKKNRYITINRAVIEAVTIYLEHTPGVCLSDYLFRSEATNDAGKNVPLANWSVNRILKGIARDLDLDIRMSTHTLRKTFCYHQMMMSHNDPRKLLLLQKMLNHSSPAQTLEYIGLTQEEIEDEYRKLNLGASNYNYLIDTRIGECDAAAV